MLFNNFCWKSPFSKYSNVHSEDTTYTDFIGLEVIVNLWNHCSNHTCIRVEIQGEGNFRSSEGDRGVQCRRLRGVSYPPPLYARMVVTIWKFVLLWVICRHTKQAIHCTKMLQRLHFHSLSSDIFQTLGSFIFFDKI